VPNETIVDPSTGEEVDTSNVIRITNAFEDGPLEPNTEIAFVLENIKNPEKSIDADTVAKELTI